jgi:hypothetical protein
VLTQGTADTSKAQRVNRNETIKLNKNRIVVLQRDRAKEKHTIVVFAEATPIYSYRGKNGGTISGARNRRPCTRHSRLGS